MYETIPLKLLPTGCQAQVHEVCGGPEDVHRLAELGLRVGTTVEMVQPGSPCILRLAGANLCFRDCDCLHVLVREGSIN